jgi:hypothetical protein
MSEIDEVERGRQANAIVESPVYKAAFDGIKQELYLQWQNSENQAQREQLFLAWQMLDRLKSSFNQTMRNGEVALKILDQKRSLLERVGLK